MGVRVGSADTKLVVIRGNSGSGKSTLARRLQLASGRGCALVEQDYLRRKVLRERDVAGGIAPDLIDLTARFALDRGYHAIVEGILFSERYAAMLNALRADHAGRTSVYYLDVSFAETVRRHATRPQSGDFTPEQMKGWYSPRDLLGWVGEHVIAETSCEQDTLDFIARTSGLAPTG